MTHGFNYRGKDLIEPLASLVSYLNFERVKVKEDLLAHDITKTNRSVMNIMDPAAQQHMATESKYKQILGDLVRAENWLREAKRMPRMKWVLDISELEWLHRTQRKYV